MGLLLVWCWFGLVACRLLLFADLVWYLHFSCARVVVVVMSAMRCGLVNSVAIICCNFVGVFAFMVMFMACWLEPALVRLLIGLGCFRLWLRRGFWLVFL